MIANIRLTDKKHILDKSFDYAVPADMEDKIQTGVRVMVPFGVRNSLTEGIVIDTSEKSEFDRLKEIAKLLDPVPVCSREQLDLCVWLQHRYFCSFFQAYKLMIPPKLHTRVQEWIILREDAEECVNSGKVGLSPLQKEAFDFLSTQDGMAEYGEIYETIKKSNLKKAVYALQEKGLAEITSSLHEGIQGKFVRMARLTVSPQEGMELAEELTLRRAAAQGRMILALAEMTELSTADLVMLSGGSYSTLNTLQERGLIEISKQPVIREAYNSEQYHQSTAYMPTDEQKVVIDHLTEQLIQKQYETVLLRGVTGSGKTEVFLQAIDCCIRQGRQAIVLVPEISLTPQMVERFVSRFGKDVAVIHSGLSSGERFDQWNKIKNGEVHVVVGARSAIFSPFHNIGIIILDEEHESSYKSEIAPRYHAAEVAEKRARDYNAVLLLASATPSVSSYWRAEQGQYKLFEMKKRYNDMALPKVKIVDMRGELFDNHNLSAISFALQAEIQKNLEKKEKTILFLNRRGYSTFVSCRQCGHVMTCENCSIALTYHRSADRLNCHYCGYSIPNVDHCPECGSKYIKFFGTGTQKIEEDLNNLFPNARVLRMDTDTTSGKNGHENILRQFGNGEADILLGTQMVTKGLDFHDVTLVGVLAADTALNVDDFRAHERCFSLLTQVCGRAGRGDLAGRAVIQTYQPQNATIQFAQGHNYIDFYKSEILYRKRLNYPPFCDIICIMISGEDEEQVSENMRAVYDLIKEETEAAGDLQMLAPVPAPILKIKNKYRYRILIKCASSEKMTELLHKVNAKHERMRGKTFLSIDINPNSLY